MWNHLKLEETIFSSNLALTLTPPKVRFLYYPWSATGPTRQPAGTSGGGRPPTFEFWGLVQSPSFRRRECGFPVLLCAFDSSSCAAKEQNDGGKTVCLEDRRWLQWVAARTDGRSLSAATNREHFLVTEWTSCCFAYFEWSAIEPFSKRKVISNPFHDEVWMLAYRLCILTLGDTNLLKD